MAEIASRIVGCIDDDVVAAYVDGALSADEVAGLEAHLSACEACRKDVSALAVVQTMRGQGDSSDAIELIPGDRIGRYVLSEERGRGAMSIVAVAADPELGRDVAIKVLRPELSSQLLRQEARAMAKLSHPNVVAVYDVGEHAGRVYVAMELVEGVDLRRWLALEPRSWRAVVAVMVEAAHGLVAAHDAGIVHRDFKPENVLCGPAERVRVTDFGLASFTAEGATGATGTPRYLAPELWAGGPATARSDQWSFCVTLYEALAGAPPFGGDSAEALRAATERGPTELPSSVPRKLRRIVARGLARDADARWASMQQLARELAGMLRPRRRWLVAGAAALVAGCVVVVSATRSPANPCDVSASLIEGAWNQPAIDAAFAASGRTHAVDSARRVGQIFDAYAGRWRIARIEACRDARVVGGPGRAVYEARTRCLDRRRDDLTELAQAFTRAPSAELVDHAVKSAFALPSFDACSAAAVGGEVLLPLSAELAPRVDAVDRELAVVRVMAIREAVGAASLARARALLATARAIGYAPLTARAARTLAHLATYSNDHATTERELDEALVTTAAAHDDRGTAEVWTERVTFWAMTRGTPERAVELAGPAEAAVVRAGSPRDLLAALFHARGIALVERGANADARTALLGAREQEADPLSRAAIDIALGTVEARLGHLDAARERLTAATATMERELGPHHPQLGLALMSLGTLEKDLHDNVAARATFERSAALIASGFGEEHVAYGLALNNLGMIAEQEHDAVTARGYLERSIASLERHGHHDLFLPLANLGDLERRVGHPAAARDLWQRALVLAKKAHGDDSERAERAHYVLGSLDFDGDDLTRALASYEEALAISVVQHGEQHLHTVEILESIGLVLGQRSECARSVSFLMRAVAASEAIYGKDHPSVARSLSAIGDCLMTMGDRVAVDRLERAVAIYDQHPGIPPGDDAYLRWTLAQATWKFVGAPGRARAIAMAVRARELYVASGDPDMPRDIDRWLATRAPPKR